MIQFPVKQVFPERHVQRVSAAFPQAMEQMKNGGRITSPMWKLFPRLRELARSRTSEVFSVLDLQQAKAYLSHPVLGKMLTEFCEALLTNPSRKEPEFLSPLCATELQASMTLFAMVGGKNSVFCWIVLAMPGN